MKFKLLVIAAVLGSSIMIPGACLGTSEELATPDPEWLHRMLQDGWEKVQPGVLRRDTGGGRVETFTYGPEGLRWMAQKLQERIASLQGEYNRYPSPELGRVIASLQVESARAASGLSAAQAEPFDGGELAAAGCEPTFGVHAAADPLTGSQGVTARADASYSSPCNDLGNVYSYAYARATSGTLMTVRIQEEPKSGGTSLASTATVSVNGSLDCYSEAYAQSWSPALNRSHEISDTNFTCPGPTTPPMSSNPWGWMDDGSVVRLTNASDSVGIGTSTPARVLDIQGSQGNARLTSTSVAFGSVLELKNIVASPVFLGAVNFVDASDYARGQIAYTGTDALTFNTSSNERVRINSAGNVGIGTSTPSRVLDIQGSQGSTRLTSTSVAFGSVLELKNIVTSPIFLGAVNFVDASDYARGQIAYTGTDALTFNTSSNERVRINSSGNVGIGTTAPAARFQVNGGDVYVSTIGQGVILRSPNGSCFRMRVSDTGALSTTAVGCP